ncbi:MAG: tRNA preQ1(34) S-adenosylmethionine ribosyltransferase-isomerase QueA [Pseudomonadales bacterium]
MRVDAFSYDLPPELIAQAPAARREGSRLLHVLPDAIDHLSFTDLPRLLRSGDLLVLNDTRVIKARLRGEKDSGGRAEVLVERIDSEATALCQVRVSKPLQAGRYLRVDGYELEVLGRDGDFYRLRFRPDVLSVLEAAGEVPLPPYIERRAANADAERYQTVYGRHPGAVAAPTAGLHFSRELLERLPSRGVAVTTVTLHVGAGTFQPIRVQDTEAHRMHFERYTVPDAAVEAIDRCRTRGGRVVAVGTTVVRTLESAAIGAGRVQARSGETDLFITPGYRFRVVDALLTNFHLPRSTLLMLVCAFSGQRRVLAAYRAAVAARYRFFSYGDAMFLGCMNDDHGAVDEAEERGDEL